MKHNEIPVVFIDIAKEIQKVEREKQEKALSTLGINKDRYLWPSEDVQDNQRREMQ